MPKFQKKSGKSMLKSPEYNTIRYKAGVALSFSLEQRCSHLLLCGERVARLIKAQPGRRPSESTLLLVSSRKSERELTEMKVFVPCVSDWKISRKLWQIPVLTISTESGNHACNFWLPDHLSELRVINL